MPEIICETCGKEFEVYPSTLIYDPPRFCSTDCFYRWLKGSKRAPRIAVKCQTCGKKMRVLKSRYEAGQGRFCSRACVNKNRPSPRRKDRVKCACRHCGKTFYKLACQLEAGRGKFCSHSCVAAHTNRNAYSSNPTSIESALMAELDERGIRYEFQHPITGWSIDFAFPEQRLAVEADGVYWHSLENVIDKDERKDYDLAKRGWTVLHFDGDQVRESVSDCVDEIVKHLQNP